MSRSIIWGGAVWVIAMMLVSVASAGANRTSFYQAIAQNRPAPNVPIPSVSPPDQKGNEAVASVAIAAIDAARHSTEESKKFYEGYSQLLVWAAGVISAFGLGGGFWFLKYQAETIAEKTAKSMLDEKMVQIDSLLDGKRTQIDLLLANKTADMDLIKNNLTDHINTYDAFNKGMGLFRAEITSNLEAFLIVIPKTLELTFWIGQHGHKPDTDPTRPDPKVIASLVLEGCAEALSKNPKENHVCAYIYGYEGVAHRLLGRYEAARDSLSKCLIYNPDNANTLYNMACCTCLLGRADEAKNHLRRAIGIHPRHAENALDDSDFATLHTDPEFLHIVGKPDQGKPDQGKPDQGKPDAEEPGKQS